MWRDIDTHPHTDRHTDRQKQGRRVTERQEDEEREERKKLLVTDRNVLHVRAGRGVVKTI